MNPAGGRRGGGKGGGRIPVYYPAEAAKRTLRYLRCVTFAIFAYLEIMDHTLYLKLPSAKVEDQAQFLIGSL